VTIYVKNIASTKKMVSVFKKWCAEKQYDAILNYLENDPSEIQMVSKDIFSDPGILYFICKEGSARLWVELFMEAAFEPKGYAMALIIDTVTVEWDVPWKGAMQNLTDFDSSRLNSGAEFLFSKKFWAYLRRFNEEAGIPSFSFFSEAPERGARLIRLLSRETLASVCLVSSREDGQSLVNAAVWNGDGKMLEFIVSHLHRTDMVFDVRALVKAVLEYGDDDAVNYLLSSGFKNFLRAGDPREFINSSEQLKLLVIQRPGACMFVTHNIAAPVTQPGLIKILSSCAMAEYLQKLMSAEVLFGTPVPNLVTILTRKQQLSSDVVEWICRHKLVRDQVTNHSVVDFLAATPMYDGTLNRVLKLIRRRYDTELLIRLYECDLAVIADDLKRMEDTRTGFDRLVIHAIKYCTGRNLLAEMDRLVSILDFSRISSVDAIKLVGSEMSAPMLAKLVSLLAPADDDRYRRHMLSLLDKKWDPVVLDRFCFANRGYRITYLHPMMLTHRTIASYDVEDPDTAMSNALLLNSAERVAALLYSGVCLPEIRLPHTLPEVNTMVRITRRGWRDVHHVVMGGSKMKAAIRCLFTVWTMNLYEAPIELWYLIASFVDMRWFAPNSTTFAITQETTDLLMELWRLLAKRR